MRIFNKVEIRLLYNNGEHIRKTFDEINKCISNGNRSKAVKIYRILKTDIGCTLKEAYDYIVELEKRTR